MKFSREADERAPIQLLRVGLILVSSLVPSSALAQTEMHSVAPASDVVARLNEKVESLALEVVQLRKEVVALKASARSVQPATNVITPEASSNPPAPPPETQPDLWSGATFYVGFDGYYGYNFNRPIGRMNLLRAYDVSSNSFSLNQANLIIERAPDVAVGRHFGGRLDLQYGQATQTLQGSAANEVRPQVYRPVFQVFGTYVAPVFRGLTIDFGKFASSIGYEGNYSKDQFNYSRSYFFNFLPFYHMGFRNSLVLNDKLTLGYWLVNGVQQVEDFNGFKSQAFQATLKPSKNLQWTSIYFFGREQRDSSPLLNPGMATLPTQPVLSTSPILPAPNGRTHIIDNYASWNVTPRLTVVGEADYVISRLQSDSAPAHVLGGAIYAHYQFEDKNALSVRGEYLSDRGGLFSGVTQALREATGTYEHKFAEGFVTRIEWRRDFSNRPFFLTGVPGVLKKEQSTATLGLIWWFGQKQGSW